MDATPRRDHRDADRWRDLPIFALADSLRTAMRDPGAAVLVAPTGSGKTTGVPILLAENPEIDGRIVVLQPRRLATRVTAQRVANLLDVGLGGGEVGFATRHERAIGRNTRIRFMTEGLFLRQMLARPDLPGIGVVVLDEFHERSLDADLLFGLLRRRRDGGEGPRLLVMSATLGAEPIADALGAPILESSTRAHPVEIEHLPRPSRDAPEDLAADVVRRLLEEDRDRDAGDILVFMPGVREIRRTVERLRGVAASTGTDLEIHALHGGMPPAEQDRALRPSSRRKAIVATNVAETSITIEGVRTVVDAGLVRVFRRSHHRPLDALRTEASSRATGMQRAGRAGRTAPGRCLRLWTEADDARRVEHPDPEVKRVDLAGAVLSLRSLGISDPSTLPWLDAPLDAALVAAENCLGMIGALGALGETGDPTRGLSADGALIARLPVHPRLGRLLLEGARCGEAARAARLAAILSERDLLPSGRGLERDGTDPDPGAPPSEPLALERIVAACEDGATPPDAIDRGALREVIAASRQLVRTTEGVALDPKAPGGAHGLVLAMIRAFPDHLALRPDRIKRHCLMPDRRRVRLDRDAIEVPAGPLLAMSLRETPGEAGETLLGLVTAVPPEWLMDALPDRLEERRDLVWNPRLSSVEEHDRVLVAGIEIDRTVRPPVDPDSRAAAEQMLAERIASGEIPLPSWGPTEEAWIERVRCVASWCPERGLPTYDDVVLGEVRRALAAGATRAKDLVGVDSMSALVGVMTAADAEFVRRMTPERITLPSGFRMKVAYASGDAPRGRARIQDLIGCDRSPAVAGGRVPVLLEILAPNQRPVQVTADLESFWKDLYPSIRNALARRYPRHRWP